MDSVQCPEFLTYSNNSDLISNNNDLSANCYFQIRIIVFSRFVRLVVIKFGTSFYLMKLVNCILRGINIVRLLSSIRFLNFVNASMSWQCVVSIKRIFEKLLKLSFIILRVSFYHFSLESQRFILHIIQNSAMLLTFI